MELDFGKGECCYTGEGDIGLQCVGVTVMNHECKVYRKAQGHWCRGHSKHAWTNRLCALGCGHCLCESLGHDLQRQDTVP